MPGIAALVDAVSTHLNGALVGRGLAPLVDGHIVIGRVRIEENVAPPRVLFVPRSSRFEPREMPNRANANPARSPGAGVRSVLMTMYGAGYVDPTVTISAPDLPTGVQATAVAIVQGGAVAAIALTSSGSGYTQPPTVTISDASGSGASATTRLAPTAEQLAQLSQRSLWTDVVTFDCHCWGIATPAEPTSHFDAAQLLYQQLIASAHAVAPGAVRPVGGVWQDQVQGAAQVDVAGHYYILGLEFRTPVLDEPLLWLSVGATADTTLEMQVGNGSPESP